MYWNSVCMISTNIYIYRAALFSPRVPNRHLAPSVQSPPRRTSPGAVRVMSHPRFSSPRGFPVAAVSVFFSFSRPGVVGVATVSVFFFFFPTWVVGVVAGCLLQPDPKACKLVWFGTFICSLKGIFNTVLHNHWFIWIELWQVFFTIIHCSWARKS